jgi:hypothetical protein
MDEAEDIDAELPPLIEAKATPGRSVVILGGEVKAVIARKRRWEARQAEQPPKAQS